MTNFASVPGGKPIAPALSVYTDGVSITGNGTAADPLAAAGTSATISLTFSDDNGAAPPGTPVCPSDTDNQCLTAKADDLPSGQVIGLVTEAGVDGETVPVQPGGVLTLTTAQWDTVLHNLVPAGLVSGALYYLSDTTAGKLTEVAPTTPGDYVTPVGMALSTTKMLIQISAPVVVT